jgi:hypothetical protein
MVLDRRGIEQLRLGNPEQSKVVSPAESMRVDEGVRREAPGQETEYENS